MFPFSRRPLVETRKLKELSLEFRQVSASFKALCALTTPPEPILSLKSFTWLPIEAKFPDILNQKVGSMREDHRLH